MWEWIIIRQTNCPSRHKGGTWGGFKPGKQLKSLGKLSDWHQLWFTSADSTENGHRLNTSRPSLVNTPGGIWGGGLGCLKFKTLGKLSNSWTDWHQIWHTSADPSGNAYIPKQIASRDTREGFRGQTFKSLGKLSNSWTDWHQLWFTSADSSGNGQCHRLNPSRPSIPQGAMGGG